MIPPPPPRSRGGDGLVAWLEKFYNAWLVSRIIRSDTYEVTETPAGSIILADTAPSRPGSSASSPPQPFDVLSSVVEDVTKLGISEFSTLGTIASSTEISGLLATSDPISPADPGLFAVPAIGEKIWLQIGTADPANPENGPQLWEATTMIRHGAVGSGNLWEEYPQPIATNTDAPDKPFQEFYNLLLAEVTDYETDPRPAHMVVNAGTPESPDVRQITQCWSRNIVVAHWVINGLLCLVPVDPALDYPASALA